jgi:hypothetical protein
MNCLSYLQILQTYGPYLSMVKVAAIRKPFAARTMPAESSALVVRIATLPSWAGITPSCAGFTAHAAVIPTVTYALICKGGSQRNLSSSTEAEHERKGP